MKKHQKTNAGGVPRTLPIGFTKAAFRVSEGWGDADVRGSGAFFPTKMAEWLLDRMAPDIPDRPPKEWEDFQWECWIFAFPAAMPVMHGGKLINPLPKPAAIKRMQQWFSKLLLEIRDERAARSIAIRTSAWEGILKVGGGGRLEGYDITTSLPWTEAFKFHVHRVLSHPAVSQRFRFCKQRGCQRPFLSFKQLYCSPSCSQRHRTQEWRQKNREKFRKWRREQYRKKKQRELGPKVRIQSRTKKEDA